MKKEATREFGVRSLESGVRRAQNPQPPTPNFQKKGQLTVFIILGLILLVTISIVIYLTTEQVARPVEEEVIVPEDAKPVYEFVNECAKDAARNGVNLLGLQGGYIYLPALIANTPTSYIPLDENAFFKLPYWYYEGEDRTPSISFMESELRRHITENVRACVGDFAPFQDRMSIEEEGELATSVLITDDSVIARIKWPLVLVSGNKRTRIEDFVMQLPVRLRQAWELANKTMTAENQHAFFENLTIDLMAGDEDIPMDGIQFTCSPERWTIPGVQERLQRVLYYHVPQVRVENTNYVPFEQRTSVYEGFRKEADRLYEDQLRGREFRAPDKEPPDDAFAYFHQLFDVGSPRTGLKAGFEYQPAWGMLLSAQPTEGGVLSPTRVRGPSRFLGFLCVQQYHFTYDLIYPVKMSIRDDTAFGGTGFVFQFAFPVIIDNNAPERQYFGLRRFEMVDYDTEFCNDLGNELVDVRALGFVEGLPFATELRDAEITLRCATQECALGNTTAEGGVYRLNTLLPRGCANPWVIADKPGYLPARQQYTGAGRLDLVLKKLQPMDISVIVHPRYGPTSQWLQPRALGRQEDVTLRLALVNSTFEQFISTGINETRIELVQDTAHYEIDAVLSYRGEQIGGYRAELVRIPYEDIAGKTEMVLHVPAYAPLPTADEQKLEMITLVMGETYQEELRPEFR